MTPGLLLSLTPVVDNALIWVDSQVYEQVKDIPMGVNPACFLADIFMFMYELAFSQRLLPLLPHNLTAVRVLQIVRW